MYKRQVIVEPARKNLIPFFDDAKNSAIEAGALGAGISGSGPTIFALCKGDKTAQKVAKEMAKVYREAKIDFDVHVSKINKEGIKIIDC